MNRTHRLLSCSPILLFLLWHLFRAPRATDISSESAMNALLLTASATELQALLQSGDLTSVQLVKACLNQIAKYDRSGPTLHAIVSTPPEEHILSVAERLGKERTAGKVRGPLHGIPIIVKVGYMRFASPEPHKSRQQLIACRTPSTPTPHLACRLPLVHTPLRNPDPRATRLSYTR